MAWKKVDNETPIWQPKTKGDSLEGEVLDAFDGRFKRQLTLDVDNREIVTPPHANLQRQIANVVKGQRIKIVFLGEEPTSIKGQNPMKLYEVFIDE